jgi:hypothetical protein
MNRRLFLRGVAGATLAAPFLSSLAGRSARAEGSAIPKRLVIFYTQNGCLTNRWFPTVENGAIDAAALTGTTLDPIKDLAAKLVFPRGLAMYPTGTINGYFDPHDQGMGSKLTSAWIDAEASTHWAQGPSLDHVAAGLVNPAGAGPLVLSVGSAFANVKGIVSYSAPNEPYTPETNVSNVYKALTGVFVTGSATTGTPVTAADYKVAQGNSIIDLVKEDLSTLQRLNMSSADQKKVTDWLALLRETEVATVAAACNAETATSLGITDADVKSAGSRDTGTAFTLGGDMMIKLMALTMMCDTNRMLLLQWPGFVTFKWDGMAHEYDHHGLSHRNGTVGVGGTCAPDVIKCLNEIDTWYAGRYSKLVHLVESIQEGEGTTMLDNSMVMWLPELADGNAHNNNNLPIVIAGSGGGYLKQGVSVNLDTKTLGTGNSEASCSTDQSVGFNTGSNTGKVPLNKLYVTLLNALGAKNTDGSAITSFGLADTNDITKGITNPGELADIKALA